ALTQDGKLMSLSLADKGWESKQLAALSKQLPLKPGEARLQAIDLDSNGAVDLVLRTPEGGVVWLANDKGAWSEVGGLPPGLTEVFPADDRSLMALSLEKQKPACFVVKGTKGYASDVYRLRGSPQGFGDNRVNPFAIGSQLEILSGTLVVKQQVERPSV